MKGARTPAGYTIVEVMIVLAVSGLMFLMAASFIGGKQEDTSFPQGVNELASSIQNTIAQVSDGQYSDINLTCNFHYVTADPQTSYMSPPPAIAAGPGTTTNNTAGNDHSATSQNIECTFLGKVLEFDEPGMPGVSVQQYQTFTLAGGRLDNNNQPITADPGPNPGVFYPTPLDDDAPTPIDPALTTTTQIPQNLNVVDISQEPIAQEPTSLTIPFVHGFSSNSSYGIGFIQDLGTTSEVGAENGSQPINIYYVNGLVYPETPAASTINGASLSLLQPGQEIVMCVTDYKQYADIEIGGSSNQLNVRVKMLGDQPSSFGANQCTT